MTEEEPMIVEQREFLRVMRSVVERVARTGLPFTSDEVRQLDAAVSAWRDAISAWKMARAAGANPREGAKPADPVN
jgi:hypothetical protein